MIKYKYNVNKNCIEKDGQFFAYLNSLDGYKIVKELNRVDRKMSKKERFIYVEDNGNDTIYDLKDNLILYRNIIAKKMNELCKENEQLKKENSVFEGKDAKHYQRWVNQIKKYVEEDNPDFSYDDDFIIKIALSYTLQSVRNGESLKRFQWHYKELNEND